VRIWSVGRNDWPVNAAELEDMKAVTREALEEGAWGLSTGLDYTPGTYASTEEITALAEVSAKRGAFTTPTPGPAGGLRGYWFHGRLGDYLWRSNHIPAVSAKEPNIRLERYELQAQVLPVF